MIEPAESVDLWMAELVERGRILGRIEAHKLMGMYTETDAILERLHWRSLETYRNKIRQAFEDCKRRKDSLEATK